MPGEAEFDADGGEIRSEREPARESGHEAEQEPEREPGGGSSRVVARAGLVMGLLQMPQMALMLVLGYWSLAFLQGRAPFPAILLPFLLPLVPLGSCLAFWLRFRRQTIAVDGPVEQVLALPRLRPVAAVVMAFLPSILPMPGGA